MTMEDVNDLSFGVWWTVPQTVAWAMSRSPELVARFSDDSNSGRQRSLFHLRHLLMQREPEELARRETTQLGVVWVRGESANQAMTDILKHLQFSLEGGRLVARGIRSNEVSPEEIPSDDWSWLKVYDDPIRATRDGFPNGTRAWTDIKIHKSGVLENFPAESGFKAESESVRNEHRAAIECNPSHRTISDRELREWYKIRIIDPETIKSKPSGEADWAAARSMFPNRITRSRVRMIRKEMAPPEWSKRGRRERNDISAI